MVKYDDVKSMVFATGRVNDGYFGETKAVEFAWYQGQTLVVHDLGYHNAGLPPTVSKDESFYLLQHHPTHKAKQVKWVSH